MATALEDEPLAFADHAFREAGWDSRKHLRTPEKEAQSSLLLALSSWLHRVLIAQAPVRGSSTNGASGVQVMDPYDQS